MPGSRRRVRDEIDDEIRFHLEERIEELMSRGMPREEAETEVRARFGDMTEISKECEMVDTQTYRRRELGETLHGLRREVRHGLRGILRAPGFALVGMLTLSLGIAATTSIFTLLDAVVLRPLPYPDAGRLVYIESAVPGLDAERKWNVSPAAYFYFRDHGESFAAIGGYSAGSSSGTLVGPEGAERIALAGITASVMDVFRLRPAIGRLILPDDDRPRAERVAVLGHEFWMRRFGGDAAVVGRTLNLGVGSATVVGVLERGAHLPDQHVDIWVPMQLDPAARPVNSHWLPVAARLKAGVSLEQAQSELSRLTQRFPELFPSAYDETFMRESRFATEVTPLHEHVVGEFGQRLWILLGSVALVLVIACANVANLFLVRAEARRREVAVRAALGAERAHLAWHYITESILLALAAGAAGLWLAYGAIRVLLRLAPTGIPRLAEVSVGWTSVGLVAAVSVAAGVAFGLFPLMRFRGDFGPLREGARGMTPSRRQHAARSVLVVAQVALALVLLAAAGLMLQSFWRLQRVDPGFEPRGVLAMDVALSPSRYPSHEAVGAFYRELFSGIEALPGVERAGAVTHLPLSGRSGCSSLFIEDRPLRPNEEPPCLPTLLASPGFFETLGIAVNGRTVDWGDFDRRSDAVVVTRALAARMWPGQDPIGKGIKGNGDVPPYYRVVGVTGDIRGDGLDKPPVQAVYFPMRPIEGASLWMQPTSMSLVVRTATADPASLAPAIRRLVRELDPQVALANVRAMDDVVARSMSRTSFTLLLLGVAAGIALVLSGVGIYGVISYVVGQRRGEIGIRMALGARGTQVAGLVVGQSVRLAAAGVVLGLAGAVATTRILRSLLFEVSPTDALTLGSVSVLLVLLAAGASYLPARRAARVDPVDALRNE